MAALALYLASRLVDRKSACREACAVAHGRNWQSGHRRAYRSFAVRGPSRGVSRTRALAAGVDSIEDRSESFLEECYITQDLTGWAAPVFGPILIGNLGDLLQTEWSMEVFYTARAKTDPNLGT